MKPKCENSEYTCEVCGIKLTKKDYWKLCRKCQPAWQIGRLRGITEVSIKIRHMLDET